MSPPAVAAAPVPTSLLARPSTQIAVSILASVCGTLVTGAAGTSAAGQLVGAALGAAVPTLISVVGPSHEFRAGAGLAITALALLVTYGGAAARDYATDSPATFPLPPGVSAPNSGERKARPDDDGGKASPITDARVVQRDAGGREIRVTPNSLACTSTQCARAVRIRSTGTAAFTVTSLEIEGEFFEHDGACVDKTLAPGEDCRVEVRYRPTSGDEPREASLVIHQTLRGGPTRVRLTGTGPRVAPTVDFSPPRVQSCTFTMGDSAQLHAQLFVSVAAAQASADTPQTVKVSAGTSAEPSDIREAPVNGAAVSLVVPIAPEDAVAGLALTVEADPHREVSESDEDNNVTSLRAASVPTAGTACQA